MPLAELIIDGFKSFANKTTIKFDTGITGIVGPNGSGKSNITEAIRWAMGEGRAKELRGNNMKDVIFAGSEFRKPLNSAQVTLVFDNHDRQLKIDDDQVSITRRILRSGDNDYLINNQTVRLKDVRELFLDSGISQNSLAIISQGRVDQILNSRPDQRREIFEEAAGTLHFKEQKETAKKQLEKTNDNLIRINDLVNELKTRIEPLHEQSSLAKEYKFQKQELDQKLKTLLAFEIQEMTSKKQTVQDKADKNQVMLAKLDEEVKASQASLAQKRKEYQAINDQKDQLQQKLYALSNELSDLNTNLQVAEQSQHFDEATKGEYQKQIKEFKLKIDKLTKELKKIESENETLQSQQEKLSLKKKKLVEEKTSPEDLNQKLEDSRNNYIEILQKQTSTNNQLTYLRTELKRNKEDKTFANDQAAIELKKAAAALDKLRETGQSKTKQSKDLQARLKQEQETASNLVNKTNNLGQNLAACRNELQKVIARRDALVNIQKRHEGYYYGVRNVLNRINDYPGVVGVVGELINFDSKFEAAMTTALGGGVQNLITQTRLDAQNAINTLKSRRAGRATFLPLDGLRNYAIPSSTIMTLKTMPGFIDVAANLVKNDSTTDISTAVNYLLGNILIVDTIESAMKINRRLNRYRIVTLDGDVISPGGSMTGGQKNLRSNSPLQTNNEINRLKDKIATLEKKLSDSEEAYNQASANLNKNKSTLQTTKEELQKLQQEINEIAVKYQNQEKEVKRLKAASELFNSRVLKQKQQISDLTNEIATYEDQQQQLEKDAAQVQQQISDLQQKINDYDALSQKLQAQISQIDPELAVLTNKLENLESQKKEKQQLLTENQSQLNDLSQKLADLDKNGVSSVKKKAELKAKSQSLEQENCQLEQQLSKLASQLGQFDAQINQLDQVASRNYDLRKDAALEQESYSVEIAKINSAIDQRLATLSSDYSLTYEAAIAAAKIENTLENRQKLARAVKLHRMSIEDIGPVNLDSIEEYENVKKRYDFLNGQQNDLLQARHNLEDSMTELDQEVKQRFKTTFEQIAAHFTHIFPAAFNGGQAKLVLTEPDDMLTTGVEIIAQPPGKKLQRLSLLSGGERALTAITLLFAMLEVNPVPFCVLDEVEAALDDANVARFAQFLQKYDLNTQFIVITHRRGTMKNADQLFGVVMQESGVSQVVSVSLKDFKEEVN